MIASRNIEKVNQVVKENHFADGFKLDVTNYSEWEILKEKIIAEYGKIDVLVNNAGRYCKCSVLCSKSAQGRCG